MKIPEDRAPATVWAEFDEPVPVERLQEYPFFADTNERLLEKMQSNLAERWYEPGDTILRAGEYGDAAFWVREGAVEVRLEGVEPGLAPGDGRSDDTDATGRFGRDGEEEGEGDADTAGLLQRFLARFSGGEASRPPRPSTGLTPEGTVVLADMPVEVAPGERVRLGEGELFGEMSALSRYPVSADVVAVERTCCLLIATAALRILLKKKDFADFKEMIDERYRKRTLVSHLRRVELFASLELSTVEGLRDRAELLSFEPGEMIVEQGEPADGFYLVRGGYVKVALQTGGGDLAVTYLRKGDYAGEVALLLDDPWPYSLSALEHVEMVKISGEDFETALAPHPEVQRILWEDVVERLKQRGYRARNPLSSQYLQMAMDTGLIHGESVLLIDLDRCTRCDDCVQACADTHGGTPRFIREGIKYRKWSVPTSCYQCTDPVCMIGCPTGAISRPIGTAEVLINDDTCIGCGNCGRRCPWGNIINVPFESKPLQRQIDLATKCDQCFGRPEGPACVQMCPHDAAIRINFKDVDTVIGTLSR